jgi:hypothetical protein
MDFPHQVDEPGPLILKPLLQQQCHGHRQHEVRPGRQVIPGQGRVPDQLSGLAFSHQQHRRGNSEERKAGKAFLAGLKQGKDDRQYCNEGRETGNDQGFQRRFQHVKRQLRALHDRNFAPQTNIGVVGENPEIDIFALKAFREGDRMPRPTLETTSAVFIEFAVLVDLLTIQPDLNNQIHAVYVEDWLAPGPIRKVDTVPGVFTTLPARWV